MNKTFIFLPSGCENDFLISCARNGLNHFGTRVITTSKLIKQILYYDDYKLIDPFYNQYIIYEIASEIPYFMNINFEDAADIYNAINIIDSLKKSDDFLDIFVEKAEFKEKNTALKTIYEKYHEFLQENNLYNDITLQQKALSKAKLTGEEIIIFEEFNLSYLEHLLLNKCFKKIKKLSISQYMGKENAYKVDSYVSSYGMVNEIEYVLSYINEHKYLYEDTNIIIFDQKYLTYLNNYQKLHDIKVSSYLNKPLSTSNPFKLFDLLYRYQKKEFFSYTSLKNILNSESFDIDKFNKNFEYNDEDIKTYADLKIEFNNYQNIERYKTLENYNERVDNFYLYFHDYRQIIDNYAILKDSFDEEAKDYIIKILDSINEYKMKIDIDTIYQFLLNKTLENTQQDINSLHIMDLNKALSKFNSHLFIIGLNSRYFPGTSFENHLLLDNDLKLFENDFAQYSYSKAEDNKKTLDAVISLYSSIGSDIHISYFDYDLEQLKQENPSSAIFEIYKKQHKDTSISDLQKEMKNIGYTDFLCSKNKSIISSYLDNKIIKKPETNIEQYDSIKLNRILSPTALEKYFTCPHYFYLRYILGLNEEDNDDPLVLIDEANLGSLVHKCMEEMPNTSTKEELISYSSKLFDEYLIKRVPVSQSTVQDKKQDYLRMVKNGYENDPRNKIIKSEMYIEFTCLDIKFKGFIDRVERLQDGTYLIVDYKTYARVKNIANDINTCLQIVLYAYGLKQNGYDVRRLEYRYLNNTRVIVVDYDEAMEKALLAKVQKFKDNLYNGKFDTAQDSSLCRYCAYSFFCKKEREDGQESD